MVHFSAVNVHPRGQLLDCQTHRIWITRTDAYTATDAASLVRATRAIHVTQQQTDTDWNSVGHWYWVNVYCQGEDEDGNPTTHVCGGYWNPDFHWSQGSVQKQQTGFIRLCEDQAKQETQQVYNANITDGNNAMSSSQVEKKGTDIYFPDKDKIGVQTRFDIQGFISPILSAFASEQTPATHAPTSRDSVAQAKPPKDGKEIPSNCTQNGVP